MNRLIILFLSIFCLLKTNLYAVNKFHPEIETGLLVGIVEKQETNYNGKKQKYILKREQFDDLIAYSIRTRIMYDFDSTFSAGVGFGLDGYSNPNYNTFPVFVSATFLPFKTVSFYPLIDVGYSLNISDSFYDGFLFDVGCGYTIRFKEHYGLMFKLYYNLKQFKDSLIYGYGIYDESTGDYANVENSFSYNNWRHSVAFSVGFSF